MNGRERPDENCTNFFAGVFPLRVRPRSACMPQRERVVVEDYNVGDRLRAYVVAVENGVRGPEIIISRSHPNFVRRLFELEVSEIADGTVEIRGIAREAGYRTKIAVFSDNPKVDPVGACVGMMSLRSLGDSSRSKRLGTVERLIQSPPDCSFSRSVAAPRSRTFS